MKRESKPEWSEVPDELKQAIETLAGARIVEATVAWGGYGPSATFILRLADGGKLFCKGTHPGLTEPGKAAFRTELSYYQSLPELSAFGPPFRGAAHHGDWQLLLLDFVARSREVPPWTDATFRGAVSALARFHREMPPRARDVLPIAEQKSDFMALYRSENGWRLLTDTIARLQFLGMFADNAAAARWLDAHLEDFIDLEAQAASIGGPRSWVHHDVRSDNLLFTDSEEPLLIDFPFLAYGPALMDVTFFLPSVAGEGGPSPMEGLRLYEQFSGHDFDGRDTAITVATVAGFFAVRAGLPDIPGLPRLRWVQKLQLVPSLAWLSELTAIEPPPPLKPF